MSNKSSRSKPKVTKFYPIAKLCHMVGVDRDHHKPLKDMEVYQWGDSPSGWRFLSQSDANKFLEIHNRFDVSFEEPVPQKNYYDVEEVAYILGLSRQRVSQLAAKGELPMKPREVTIVTLKALRRWFGDKAMREASIDPNHYYFTPEEAAERLGMPAKEMHRMIDSGDLPESTSKNVTIKLMISKRDLLRFIKRSVKID